MNFECVRAVIDTRDLRCGLRGNVEFIKRIERNAIDIAGVVAGNVGDGGVKGEQWFGVAA